MTTWQLQTAKAKLSELLRAVREHGPQTISVRGKEEFVVSLKAETPGVALGSPPKSLWDLFDSVRGLGDDLELPPREVGPDRRFWWDEEKHGEQSVVAEDRRDSFEKK